MSDGDGDTSEDDVVLDRLIGMKDEWLHLEAEIRNKAVSLQNELTQQRNVNEDLAKELDEARKSKDESLVQEALKQKDTEIESLKKQNSEYLKKLEKSPEITASDNLILIEENEKLRTRLEESSAKILALNNNKGGDHRKLLEDQQEEIRSLRSELQSLKDSKKDASTEKHGKDNEQGEEVKELQNLLLEKTNEVARNVEQIQDLKRDLAMLEEEYGVLKSQHEALKEELRIRNEANPDILEINKELKRTKMEMQVLVDDLHKLKEENRALSERTGPQDEEGRELLELKLENTVQVLMMKNKMLEDVIKERDQAPVRRWSPQPGQEPDSVTESKKRDEETNKKSEELLRKRDEEVMKLQDKLSAAFESEKALLTQVQQLQHQAVAQLLQEQNLKQQLVEAHEAVRVRQATEQSMPPTTGEGTNAQEGSVTGSPPIKDEAHILTLQNKIYHLALSLDEANAKVSEAHEKSREDQERTADDLNALLRDRELNIVELERQLEQRKETDEGLWKFKALGNVMNELKEKQAVTGAYDEAIPESLQRRRESDGGTTSDQTKPRRTSDAKEHEVLRARSASDARESDRKAEIARKRISELEAEVQALIRNVEELTDELNHTEEVSRTEITKLRKHIAELIKEGHTEVNANGKGEERETRRRSLHQGEVIDRAVHEAALEMLRTIQREHTLEAERVGREFGEEKFRHQETIRKLQEVTQTNAFLRKKLKSLTGSEYFDESDTDNREDNEVSEMQRLREAIAVAVMQVEEERKSLAREREAHVLTHSILREERLRCLKEKDELEEQIAASRKNLAEVVEEVLEAESSGIERERQLVSANMRIKELEARLQDSSKMDIFKKPAPQPRFSYVSAPTPHYPSAHDVPVSQPSTQIPQMRTARVPGDTYTLSQSTNIAFSDSTLRASYSAAVPFSPTPPPLTLSQIRSPYPTQPSVFAPPRPLSQPFSSSHTLLSSQSFPPSQSFSSQPFSSQPITSPQPTRHPIPPRPSPASPTPPTYAPQPTYTHPPYTPQPTYSSPNYTHVSPHRPALSPTAPSNMPPSNAIPRADTPTATKPEETPKDELVALLSRTSQAIASKSTEMENIRKQLQATEQRLRVLQRDKDDMDAQRSVLRDGMDAFGKSIGH